MKTKFIPLTAAVLLLASVYSEARQTARSSSGVKNRPAPFSSKAYSGVRASAEQAARTNKDAHVRLDGQSFSSVAVKPVRASVGLLPAFLQAFAKDTRGSLVVAYNSNSVVREPLLRLQEMFQNRTSLTAQARQGLQETLPVIGSFLAKVKNIANLRGSADKPTAEGVLHDIAANSAEIPTWSKEPRANVTNIMRSFVNRFIGKATAKEAFDGALVASNQMKGKTPTERYQEIRRRCRK